MYTIIKGEKQELGNLDEFNFYFLVGHNADYQKGVLYARLGKGLALVYNDKGEFTRITKYAGKSRDEFSDLKAVRDEVESGKYSIPAKPYLDKWNKSLDVMDLNAPEPSMVPNTMEGVSIRRFKDFS
jgi:hypothetical protein